MIKVKFIIVLMLFILPGMLFPSTELGPDPSVYRGRDLKWEDGAYGYHVMFKTLLESMSPNPENPQADKCIDPAKGSTYKLNPTHVPPDANIHEAFLIWAGAVRTTKLQDPTDHEVLFNFVSEDGRISENQVIAGKKAFRITESEGFEFEAFRESDNPSRAYFTYRVDVTDFFRSIHEKGRELGNDFDGFSLYGDYTVSQLECTDEEIYKGDTLLVSGWIVVMVYTSVEISPKKLYLYNGFKEYWHEETEINVTGFEFPSDPEVRLTLAVYEGDANLASLSNPRGGPLIPESLQVQGDQYGWLLLSDKCNPEAFRSDGMTSLTYTEIFNSVSSVYGWNDTEPTCVGGVPPMYNFDEMEWGMDVDTFVMDSSLDGAYAAHFNRGGQRIGLKIGVNQDMIITNFLMVSVDTKAPTFDIPGENEKVICSPANQPLTWCDDGDHTFAIRVQNWGDDLTGRVTVRDTIPNYMTYVPGSTEYATEFDVVDGKKIAKRWIPVPDDDGGGFPLERGLRVKDTMEFCPPGSNYLSCEEFVIVRFRATVNPGTPKHAVIENVAQIETPGFSPYNTNLGIPIRVLSATGGCVAKDEDIDLSDCGGRAERGCESDDDCGEFQVCDTDNGMCMDDPSIVRCKDSDIKVSVGRNSPTNDVIFIKPDTSNLVVGQLEIVNLSEEECYFNLSSINLNVAVDDNNVQITNIRMVYDENNNGIVDGKESAIGKTDMLTAGTARITSNDNYTNRLWGDRPNNILFVVDVAYREGERITQSASFTPSIDREGIVISDGGKPVVSGLPINGFSKFQIEPDDAFIITKTDKDPEIPQTKDMNTTRDIMHLRAVSNGEDDKITSIRLRIPSGGNYVNFGAGISSVAIYEDTNNDGSGDKKIASVNATESPTIHTFRNLDIEMKEGVERFFTIRASLNLSENDKMRIQVQTVEVDSKRNVLGTPINSKEYHYVCDPMYEVCGDDGCTCTMVSVNDSDGIKAIFMLLSILSLMIFFKRRSGVIQQ